MIDTLKVAEQLKASGFDDTQARAITNAIASSNEQLDTKQETQGVGEDIRQDLKINRWLLGLSLLLNMITLSGIIAILILVVNLP